MDITLSKIVQDRQKKKEWVEVTKTRYGSLFDYINVKVKRIDQTCERDALKLNNSLHLKQPTPEELLAQHRRKILNDTFILNKKYLDDGPLNIPIQK